MFTKKLCIKRSILIKFYIKLTESNLIYQFNNGDVFLSLRLKMCNVVLYIKSIKSCRRHTYKILLTSCKLNTYNSNLHFLNMIDFSINDWYNHDYSVYRDGNHIKNNEI